MTIRAGPTSARTSQLSAQGRSTAAALTGGYHLGFWISAGLVLVGVVVASTVLTQAETVDGGPPAGEATRPDLAADAAVA